MKSYQSARAAVLRIGSVAAAAILTTNAAMAQAVSPFDAFFDAVDLTGLSVKVIAAGVLVVGIALAFKGPDVAKRVVRKV